MSDRRHLETEVFLAALREQMDEALNEAIAQIEWHALRSTTDARPATARMHPTTERGDRASMFQVRIHGRGGQGVVTAAELLSVAAFLEGREGQAFPTFGSERTGAPVVAFCRMDDRPIRVREPIAEPDAVIVQDPTLVHQVDLFGGLGESGYLLVNTSRAPADLGLGDYVRRFDAGRCATVPATDIARARLGRPLPNAALLGAFAALTGEISLDSVAAAIRERFSGATGEQNVAAAEDAYEIVRKTQEATHA
jgi:pyruvate ferredoxin oxidoreductase gamma subunit